MMLGHTSELRNLNEQYDKDGSQIVVVYGQKNIGKTFILNQFISDKDYYYYKARAASEREQLYQWGREISLTGAQVSQYPVYSEILSLLPIKGAGKFVLIMDEFHHIIKGSNTFMSELIHFIDRMNDSIQIMVLLCSSSVGWVKNNLFKRVGDNAGEFSELLKVKELSFDALTEYFEGFRIEECIEAYAVLGGTPGLWKYFDDKLTIKDNICRFILTKDSILFKEGQRIVAQELRETSVYNTLLAAMAEGKYKLNDLYLHTGFSRAKISVYLKHLIELDLVEKIYSYDAGEVENVKVGMYRISNHFVDFYFTYMYPNMTVLEYMDSEDFYKEYIRPTFKAYVAKYFKEVCTRHIELMNKRKRLPIVFEKRGEWVGKDGVIDIIAQDSKGVTLIGLCNWDKPIMTHEDYESLLYIAGNANIQPDYIFLYSVGRFDEKLNLEAKIKQNMKLISVDDF